MSFQEKLTVDKENYTSAKVDDIPSEPHVHTSSRHISSEIKPISFVSNGGRGIYLNKNEGSTTSSRERKPVSFYNSKGIKDKYCTSQSNYKTSFGNYFSKTSNIR